MMSATFLDLLEQLRLVHELEIQDLIERLDGSSSKKLLGGDASINGADVSLGTQAKVGFNEMPSVASDESSPEPDAAESPSLAAPFEKTPSKNSRKSRKSNRSARTSGASFVSARGKTTSPLEQEAGKDGGENSSPANRFKHESKLKRSANAIESKLESMKKEKVGTASASKLLKHLFDRDKPISDKKTQWGSARIAKLVDSKYFDVFCALVIIFNAGVLGVSADLKATGRNDADMFFYIATKIVSLWFLLEISLRIAAEGPSGFICHSRHRSWNIFDSFVVGMDLVEFGIESVSGFNEESETNVAAVRMLRVLRIARALRIVRLARVFKELRLMVLSIFKSGMSLLWSMVLLGIIIYIFGIYLMQDVTDHMSNLPADEEGTAQTLLLRKRFGSLTETIYTLFMAVSGGLSWVDISDPLIDIDPLNGVVLCFFIFFTIFAMLNIITGIFVETAFRSVHSDQEEVIQEELHEENSALRQLQRLFEEADTDKSGEVSLDEFEILLANDRTRALMKNMGLSMVEARTMFDMIDMDNSGNVSINEFVVSCMRMRGGAKSVDLITLMYENKRVAESWRKFEISVEDHFKEETRKQDRLTQLLWNLTKMVRAMENQQSLMRELPDMELAPLDQLRDQLPQPISVDFMSTI